jgi:hypothetical protein
VLPESVQVARSDLIAFDGIRLGEIGKHITDEAARDGGR